MPIHWLTKYRDTLIYTENIHGSRDKLVIRKISQHPERKGPGPDDIIHYPSQSVK